MHPLRSLNSFRDDETGGPCQCFALNFQPSGLREPFVSLLFAVRLPLACEDKEFSRNKRRGLWLA